MQMLKYHYRANLSQGTVNYFNIINIVDIKILNKISR